MPKENRVPVERRRQQRALDTRNALLDTAMGPCVGKGSDEQSLLRKLLDTLEADDILLGDAFYATYFLLAALIGGGVDGVFEQHGARKRSTDFSR
mgnify:CR=1 FL=1